MVGCGVPRRERCSRKNADAPLPRFHSSAVPDVPREARCAPPPPTLPPPPESAAAEPHAAVAPHATRGISACTAGSRLDSGVNEAKPIRGKTTAAAVQNGMLNLASRPVEGFG